MLNHFFLQKNFIFSFLYESPCSKQILLIRQYFFVRFFVEYFYDAFL